MVTQRDLIARVNTIKSLLYSLDIATPEQLNNYCLRKSPMGGYYSLERIDPKIDAKTWGRMHWLCDFGGMKAALFYEWQLGVIKTLTLMMEVQKASWKEDHTFTTTLKWG